jgi:hypothetical protein
MRRRLLVLFLLLAVGLTLTLLVAGPAAAIKHGQPDNNNHPYACLVVFYNASDVPMWRTTGELISPTVVVTAGHGTYDDATGLDCAGARVWFLQSIPTNPNKDPNMYPYGGPDSYHGTPYTNPDYRRIPLPGLTGYDYHDVGVVVLDRAAPVTQFAKLPSPGLVDTLGPGHRVDLVGYGVNYQVRGGGVSPYDAWQWARARYYAPAQIVTQKSALGSQFLKLSANPAQGKGGITFGDSGGPILDAGTNVVLGENSFVTNSNCSGVTYAQRLDIPDILAWISSYTK